MGVPVVPAAHDDSSIARFQPPVQASLLSDHRQVIELAGEGRLALLLALLL